MEHLDLAGVITAPTNWLMPAFDQQDAIYLSNSRQMLEPILEETSEDEERAQNSWNQYEHATSFWSSAESETGSVIRIEVNKDPDSISERDFACPAKRARRSEEFLIGGPLSQQPQQSQQQQQHLQVPNALEDVVQLRKHQRSALVDYNDTTSSLERFLAYEACSRDSLGTQRSSTGSRRFDDFYSDSDSLSYHSLSRSSSLIQFESLERQLLLNEQHASMNSLGNSSPSLLSFDGANTNIGVSSTGEDGARSGGNSGSNSGNNSRRGSQSSLLKRFESSDGRLHQTYLDLDKLNFDDEQRMLFGASKSNLTDAGSGGDGGDALTREVKSDSESSTTSSSGHSILSASKPSAEDLTDSSMTTSMLSSKNGAAASARLAAFQRGGKNSVENLSEDSGYCEPATLRRVKSKSIPKNFDKFCEEEEEFEFEQYERGATTHDDDDEEHELNGEQEDEDDEGDEEKKVVAVVVAARNTHSKNSNIIHHYDNNHVDICQPKINAAKFTLDALSNEATFNEPTKATTTTHFEQERSPLLSRFVKNSPTREQSSTLEHRRSLAHSPSPVSSVASSGSSSSSSSSHSTRSSTTSASSASTCASAASFTWHLPTQMPQSRTPAAKQTLGDFSTMLRNSLPDIRDALGSEAYFLYNHQPTLAKVNAFNGYVLEELRATTTGAGIGATTTTKTTTTKAKTTETDDSDISTSSSSSAAHDSRSDATDIESTPETKKRIVGGGGGIGSIKGGIGNQRALRQSSVPNELDKLGRRRRTVKAKYSKSSTEEESTSSNSSGAEDAEEQDLFDDSCLKIRRSCSWSERRNWRNLQRFEESLENNQRGEEAAQSLGYMNASYQNLTLLDYSGDKPQINQAYYKRSSCSDENMDKHKEKRKSGGDYETIICKGNFLLDELSEIYDKNASILNDQRIGSDVLEEPKANETLGHESLKLALDTKPSTSPKPPPRQRKQSNSSFSDLENLPEEEEAEVQHVQLTIRKPPARQKHGRKCEGTNSLTSELPTSTFGSFGKPTFDQDPTNLRTSYAQSLEKCNFDTKELSNTDLNKLRSLPKRRFHTQAASAKKKNLVSSTPNLNAFDPGADEIEDDIYVSSAHTSMHQLPQSATAQKPLGILLPAGSRTSFSKEVSFCPVVSKYCWQEQSSEECNEPTLNRQLAQEEESDDELLDNADATVIYNTKENEQIAARYKEEHDIKQLERECTQLRETKRERDEIKEQLQIRAETPKQRADVIVQERKTENIAAEECQKTSHNDDAKHDSNAVQASEPSTPTNATPLVSEVSFKPTIVATTTLISKQFPNEDATRINHNKNYSGGQSSKKSDQPRPLSIQLPILSEPPTNRAHHILYASQQMLDNLQRREREEREQDYIRENNAGARAVQTKALSVSNLNTHGRRNNGMFHYTDEPLESGSGAMIKGGNNNNELAKGKFKADEKHPSSKGFLSRFTNGFRFSLRRNKKKQLQQQKEQQQLEQQQLSEQPNGGVMTKPYSPKENQNKAGQLRSPDFIYIPLKGPLLAGSRAVSNATIASGNSNGNAATGHNDSIASTVSATSTASVTSSATTAAAKIGAKSNGNGNQLSSQSSTQKVTGKPPLPKLPPRTVSLPQQQNQQQQQSAGPGHAPSQNVLTDTNFTPPQQRAPSSSSKFYTDESFLAAERDAAAAAYHYDDFANQLNSGMQANGSVSVVGLAGSSATMPAEFASPSRASVSQKTQMFNKMGGGMGGGVQSHNTFGHHKIGLIETNLDTHETVISGKTRSLMDIGPQGGKRLNLSSDAADDDYNIDEDDDDDVYVDGGAGVGRVLVKSKPHSGGGGGGNGQQIASVRRPHKSMEFLLDKENQKNVLITKTAIATDEQHDNNTTSTQCLVNEETKLVQLPRTKTSARRNLNLKPEHSIVGTNNCSDCECKSTIAGGIQPLSPPPPFNPTNFDKNPVLDTSLQVPQDSRRNSMPLINGVKFLENINHVQNILPKECDNQVLSHEISPILPSVRAAIQKISSIQLNQQALAPIHPQPCSFIDQGFETASTYIDSPIRSPNRSTGLMHQSFYHETILPSVRVAIQKLAAMQLNEQIFERMKAMTQSQQHSFIDQDLDTASTNVDSPLRSQNCSIAPIQNNTDVVEMYSRIPFKYSTPIRNDTQFTFNSIMDLEGFSPVLQSAQNSRQSSPIHEVPSQLNSLEEFDQYLHSPYSSGYQSSFNTATSETELYPLIRITYNLQPIDHFLDLTKNSNFWIIGSNFNIRTPICYYSTEMLSSLYDIFLRKSFDTHDLHFGIDEYNFSAHHGIPYRKILFKPMIKTDIRSQYWFSTGDLVMSFFGKFLNKSYCTTLFNFLRRDKSTNIRFGIDCYEFSNVPFMWQYPATINTFISPFAGIHNHHNQEEQVNHVPSSNLLKNTQRDLKTFDATFKGRVSISPPTYLNI